LVEPITEMNCPKLLANRCTGPDSRAVVFFALVPNSTHDHIVTDDFKQNDVARAAKRHDQLTRTTISQLCIAA
jgi:hypothetical protein